MTSLHELRLQKVKLNYSIIKFNIRNNMYFLHRLLHSQGNVCDIIQISYSECKESKAWRIIRHTYDCLLRGGDRFLKMYSADINRIYDIKRKMIDTPPRPIDYVNNYIYEISRLQSLDFTK